MKLSKPLESFSRLQDKKHRLVLRFSFILLVSLSLLVLSKPLQRYLKKDLEIDLSERLGSDLIMSPEEEFKMKVAANAGDGEAAYDLYLHFAIGLQNQDEARRWLELSSKHGFQTAKDAIETLDNLD